MSLSRLATVATLSIALITATAAADQTAPQDAATARASVGTPATPTPNVLFDDTRIMRIDLAFSQKEYAALAPHHVGGAGNNQNWLQGPEGRRNGLSASRGLEFPFVHADASVDGTLLKDIGVRYKGNGTFMLGQQVGKMSFKLDFNQYVKGQKLGTIKTLNLHSNVTDASYMNETLAFRLHRDAGSLAPRAGFARVFITVTGKYDRAYYGLFGVVENPDTAFMVARGLPEDGAIFKPVTTSLFADLGTSWAKYNQTYDPKTTLTSAQQQRVIDFSKLVTHGNDADFTAQVRQYLEIAQTARYLALVVCLSDVDSILGFGQNYYLYLDPRTNKFSFAAWDQDHSFGQFFFGSQNQRERLSIERPWTEPSRFLTRLMKLDQFRNAYLAEIGRLTKTLFTPERLSQQVDELADLLRPAVREESAKRLAKFEQAVIGQAAEPDDPMFRGATVPIKPFMRARVASLNQQLGR